MKGILCCLIILFCFTDTVLPGEAEKKIWIFFTDKEVPAAEQWNPLQNGIHPLAVERRLKRGSTGSWDSRDIPIYQPYLNAIERMGCQVIQRSRWLNAVTVRCSESIISRLQSLPFVRTIHPVRTWKHNPEPDQHPRSISKSSSRVDDLYGYSAVQLGQIRLPEVHALGLTGKGVRVGLLDTGFNTRTHIALSDIHIYTEYDFVQNDFITSNEYGDHPEQQIHGTQVLAVIGAYHPGYMMGAAHEASFALAKTELVDVSDDTIEIDYWVAGLEWLESRGVDIVTNSLAFYTFVNGPDYRTEDLDGDTFIPTVAADIAVSKGVVFLSAAGNSRHEPWHYIISPADGDSVIAVGAVTAGGNSTYFSSVGPTADGRFKPDVMALGTGVVTVDLHSYGGYYGVSGTSFSSPLAAGVCALMLQARPELTPMEVREALRQTASQWETPDNDLGWGIINAYEAVFFHGPIFTRVSAVSDLSNGEFVLESDVFYKDDIKPDSVFIHYRCNRSSNFVKYPAFIPSNQSDFRVRFRLPGEDVFDEIQFYFETWQDGSMHQVPLDSPHRLYTISTDTTLGYFVGGEKTEGFRLLSAYPNPFNESVRIRFSVYESARVTLEIFNLRGQRITTLLDQNVSQGINEVIWNGNNSAGMSVPSGIYFCRFRSAKTVNTMKLLYVR
ncbi:MAG TPA: T9SS type A sorting domain-containing protein [bacterium]|nr:T9SS type A sorting domain-containing protein [bacterium]